MKRITFIVMIGAVIMTSCNDSANEGKIASQLDVDLEATIESSFEDVDVLVDAGIDGIEDAGRGVRDFILDCAIVERDTATHTIIIDYGDGCVGHGDRLRSGKIIISHTGRKFEPGSVRTVTFENFKIDSVQVEGVRTITNVTDTMSDYMTFSILLEGGKLTFLDGSFATRDAEHTRNWYRSDNPMDDYSTLDGGANGVNQDGLNYTVEITETLIFKRACLPARIFVPVSGQKVLTIGEEVEIIDFGDGECDDLITVIRDGESESKSLNMKRRRGRGRG